MKTLRTIFAITLITLLLIGNLIGDAAHAGPTDHVGADCETHLVSDDGHLAGHVHASAAYNLGGIECCEPFLCQAVVISDHPTLAAHLGFQMASGGQVGQLSAVSWPSTLERPPNS